MTMVNIQLAMTDAKIEMKHPETEREESGDLQQSTKGASFLFVVQILTKLFTFLLNQLVIRYISPKVFGIAAYFEFLASNILFISREGIRLAAQRIDIPKENDKKHDGFDAGELRGTLQSILNLGHIPLFLSLPIMSVFLYWQYGSNAFQNLFSTPYIRFSFMLVAGSVACELLVEPLYLLNQFHLDFKKRSKYESIAIFGRCSVTFCGVIVIRNFKAFENLDYDGIATLVFTLGQFTYSFVIFLLYSSSFHFSNWNTRRNSLWIKRISKNDERYYFDPKAIEFWKSVFLQMLFKQFLTEGDKLLTSYICTIEDQGVYSVVSNYGSIIARLLFQPIEESIRLLFTRILSDIKKENIQSSLKAFKYLSLFYLNFSILIFVGGYINGSYLLRLLLGGKVSQWENTNIWDVFPQYVIYIPFMAFNGILEAFFSSVATVKHIKNFSIFMSLSTILILTLSYFLISVLNLGIFGLILSNIANMILRIIYCTFYYKDFYAKTDTPISLVNIIRESLPKLVSGALAFAAHKFVLGGWRTSSFIDLVKSALICICLLLHLLFLERKLILSSTEGLRNKYFGNKGKND